MWGKALASDEQIMVKTVAGQSSHPLSRLVVKSLGAVVPSRKVIVQFEEQEGAGIRAVWGRGTIRIGSLSWVDKGREIATDDTEIDSRTPRVYLAIDEVVKGYFDIRAKYRPGLTESLSTLREQGYAIYLLSGDQPTDINKLGNAFGGASRLFFRQKPQEKLSFVENLQEKEGRNVLMVGDGLNDAGALQQSDVGLAVSDDVNNFSPACDVILQGEKLALLPRYIRLAEAGQRIIKTSFGISILYNLIGISYAVTGQLSPVTAAIIMPISSITIVLFTTLSTNRAARKYLRA